MRGCIKFSNGDAIWFTDLNYREVVSRLTEEQKSQLADILIGRLGSSNPLPVEVDKDVYAMWHEDTHRKDVMLGGGSGSEPVKINKKGGKRYSDKPWAEKGSRDQNIVWLRNMGFRKRWNRDLGYRYLYGTVELDLNLIEQLDHESFKLKVKQLMEEI